MNERGTRWEQAKRLLLQRTVELAAQGKLKKNVKIYTDSSSMSTYKTKGAERDLRQIVRTVPAGQTVKSENTRGRRGRLTNGISTTEGHSETIALNNARSGLDVEPASVIRKIKN